MPTYTYTARDSAGNVLTGDYEGPDKGTVRADLRKMQYAPLSVVEKTGGILSKWQRHVRRSDLLIFAHQFSGMYGAGLSLMTVLRILQDEAHSAPLKEVLRDMREQIEGGSTLRDAFGRHPEVFSDFLLGMIEAGETGGVLGTALERLAFHLQKQEELKQKVISAFAYPIVVSVLCCLVVSFLVIFIVPVFASAYAKFGVSLPGPTVALVAASDFARGYWWAVLGGLTALGLTWRKIRRTTVVDRTFDTIKMRAPLFGALNRKVAVTRFVRTLADMLGSGVSLLRSVTVAEGVAGSRLIGTAAHAIRASVEAGGAVTEPMRSHSVFPAMVIQMAAAGEESGTLPDMLRKSAAFLDRDIDRIVARLIVKLEPLLTAGVAVVVGLILMAVYLPIFDIMKLGR